MTVPGILDPHVQLHPCSTVGMMSVVCMLHRTHETTILHVCLQLVDSLQDPGHVWKQDHRPPVLGNSSCEKEAFTINGVKKICGEI